MICLCKRGLLQVPQPVSTDHVGSAVSDVHRLGLRLLRLADWSVDGSVQPSPRRLRSRFGQQEEPRPFRRQNVGR